MLNFSVADKSSSESNTSKKSDNQPQYLELDEIRRDGGTQPRAAINLHHVKLLEEQLEEGHQLEPVIVFYDGEFYWLADAITVGTLIVTERRRELPVLFIKAQDVTRFFIQLGQMLIISLRCLEVAMTSDGRS